MSKIILVVFLAMIATSSLLENKGDDINIGYDQHKESLIESRKNLLKQFLTTSPENQHQRQHEVRLKTDLQYGFDWLINNRIQIVKKNDTALADMLLNFYQKNVEFDDIARSIVKYVMIADKGTITFDVPLDSYMLMSIKNFRDKIIYN